MLRRLPAHIQLRDLARLHTLALSRKKVVILLSVSVDSRVDEPAASETPGWIGFPVRR